MKAIDLFNSITALPAELVEEAETHRFQKKTLWVRYAAAAAALALVIGVGGILSGRVPSPMAGAGSGGGDAGGENGYSYMHYVGPVLPLTAASDAAGVTAERRVNYDFSPYKTRTESLDDGDTYETWRSEAIVTDDYTLTNTTGEDKTLTLLYPAALTVNEAAEQLPVIAVNGAEREVTLFAGSYSGGFRDASGGKNPNERLNLDQISDWEGYASLLSDGSYQAAAFAPAPDLNIPVTVYRVDDYLVAPTDAVNPSLQISFHIDYDRTTVMTYGSNGGSDDREGGVCSRIVGGLANEYRPPEPMYFVLYGDDIDDYALQGYANMGGDSGTEIDVTATVTRYETTLDVFLRQIIDGMLDGRYEWQYGADLTASEVPRELLYRLAAELLTQYSVLSDDPYERYFGMLEEVFEAYSMRRILYLSFDVTVPAGASVRVTATMRRDGSYDFIGKRKNVDGYDLATRLGSTLFFTEQAASVSHTEEITMGENSFGFDPDGGVTEVTLDTAVEHYWMQVTKRG